MTTADDLIAWYREEHPSTMEVARVISTIEGSDDFAGQIILLDAAATADDDSVTITQIARDEEGQEVLDAVYLDGTEMDVLASAWLKRRGYSVTQPAMKGE